MNTDSGKSEKVFTLNRNECSRSTGIGVHVEPEWVFMMGWNTHLEQTAEKVDATIERPEDSSVTNSVYEK